MYLSAKIFLRHLTLLINTTVTIFAQSEQQDLNRQDYVIKVWGPDNGLTENSVTDVAQTPEGYLWIGTVFGSVLRFDGVRFDSYNSANAPEFSLKWGRPNLMVDQVGTLWISTHDGGLTTWDHQGFHLVNNNANQPDRLLWSAQGKVIFVYNNGKLLFGKKSNDQWAWKIATPPGAFASPQWTVDVDGRVWYLHNGNRIGILDGFKNDSVALISGFGGQKLQCLAEDSRERIWIGTDKALGMWQTDHFDVMTPTNGEPVLNVISIISSGRGNLWVNANGRMRCCSEREWTVESDEWDRELGQQSSFNFLQGDHEGGVWAGADGMGLIHVAANGDFRRLTTQDGLPSDTVGFAYEDHDGNIWSGYERGGLVQVRRRLFHNIGKNEGLSDRLINTVSEDSQGALWIGTHSGLVSRFQDGVCSNIDLPGAESAEDSCAVADMRGVVWIGARGVGLWKYESGRGKLLATQTQLQSYPRQLLPTREGRLWVGTVWSIDSVMNGKLTVEYKTLSVGGHPTALAETTDGTIWVGTLSGALMRWDANQFMQVEPPEKGALGRIWALCPGADNSLWAGTEVGGLLHWSHGKFFRYTTKNGLPSDSIEQILIDTRSNLWLGTRAGIIRISGAAFSDEGDNDSRELPISTYGQTDGLLTIGSAMSYEPNCWNGRDGILYFATDNSVTEVNPAQVRIAQDLHDDLGAGLTEIGLLGGLLQDPCQFSTRKQEALECIVQRCHDLVVALDEIVWAINPRNDSFNSLGSYLCRYAQRFLEPTGIRCRLEMSVVKPDYSLNSDQRHNLFLTFKEALTNIVKHSGATGVRIKISVAKKCCLINVEDNGHGLPSIIEPGGEGLDNLHRRMAQIGGECEIINEPGRGVSVRLRLPLVD